MSGKGQSKTNPSKMIFGPNANITRAEFVTVLYNRQDKPGVQYRAVFTDVPEGKWFTAPVLWAYENGISKGYGEKFGINDPITREQMAKMLYEYAKLLGGNMNYDESAWANFGDTNKVNGWAIDSLKWATSKGVINGSKGANDTRYMIKPKGNATRAECAAMIKNLIEKVLTN